MLMKRRIIFGRRADGQKKTALEITDKDEANIG